ncbi:MAG: hypothetical protein B9S38_07135, partial [Verrucomicrobiia bacterium Tous-C4TDCM]
PQKHRRLPHHQPRSHGPGHPAGNPARGKRLGGNATKIPTDPWKNEYRYRRLPDSSPRPFELRCVGPDGIAGNEDDRVSE